MSQFLVTTSKALEPLLLEELKQLCPQLAFASKPGQVSFSGELADAYRICLWSRLANRVLLQVAQGECKNAEQLYQLAASVPWRAHFALDKQFAVDFIGKSRSINNSQFGALKIKDAVVDHFNHHYQQRPNVSKQAPDIRIQARLWRDNLSLHLDLSGGSLHQRAYRQQAGIAPLKEHLAAAILMRSGWQQEKVLPLFDPMCGAGTIVIEAALMATNRAPGLTRQNWGFTHWLGHEQALWQCTLEQAEQAVCEPECQLFANDLDQQVLALAKQNAAHAGVADFIVFSNQDASCMPAPCKPGYVVSNPPYAERLGELSALVPLFQNWGQTLKQHYANWQLSLLTSNRDLLRQLKLQAHKEYQLMNGKIACQLVNYNMHADNCQVRESSQGGEDFANRLRKNLKATNKWLKSQNTQCYRLYDADLPDYKVAVDRYGDYLVVQEYAAPKDIPEQKAQRRLQQVLLQLPVVTGTPAKNIVVKERKAQKGSAQYQKLGEANKRIVVNENGAQFYVNLWDYLDTGLFLDHRQTRQLVQQQAKGKDVLNLFAYTGSVSVFAARGGARSVTTVDMSRTYLQWAKDNFSLNKLRGAYQFEQANCIRWLAEHNKNYDLIFIDPPSFSNSKRMQDSWDVQRDHLALLTHARRCLRPGGQIIFSNNLRKFKLDQAGVSELGLHIDNISKQTLPDDFKRNPHIHQCWLLSLEENK